MDSDAVIVILTALNLEYQSVRRLLSSPRRLDHPAGTVFEIGRLPGGNGLIALTTTGEGNTAAAVLAERAIVTFSPLALMFVGVAGALRDGIALGDVVVATKVYAYHGGEARQDKFLPRPRSWEISHRLDQAARHVHRAGTWVRLLEPGPPHPLPAVHFKPVAAGEVVLNSRDGSLAERLRRSYGDAVAIEMESAGAAQAAHLNDRLPVLSVRGISDRADGAKHEADCEGWQTIAAASAAAFALAVGAELCASAGGSRRAARGDPVPWQGSVPWQGPSPAAAVVPRQLPAAGDFIAGRAEYLCQLDDILLRPGAGPAIAVLTGMAGAGKTALAVHWAQGAAPAFPDGQLYADVRGFGPGPPAHPREILAGFLRALGQSEAAERGSVDERAARFRSAVSSRRMIVLLDNVASVEQVRLLLPGAGMCAVLITSREHLHGLAVHNRARVLEVGRLPERDAVAVLRTAMGERAAPLPGVELLAARCAGLPLALRIAAELAVSHPAADIAALAGDLGDSDAALDALDTGDDPYSAVRTVFSWSYQALASPVAAAFRLLGLHPAQEFGLPAAAALLNLPGRQAARTMHTLVSAHLVTQTPAGRFEMHDLLRAYARDLCARSGDQPGQREAALRMVDQYLHTADQAGRVIMPYRYRVALDGAATVGLEFTGRAAAMHWFDQEWRNLVELCRLGAAELDSRRWRLAYVLRDYFFVSKHLDGWLETHRLAAAGCERLADRHAEGMTRNNLGRALLEAGQLDAAAAQYRQARSLLEQAGDEQGVTDARVNLAAVSRRQGAYAEALREQLAALASYQEAGLGRKAGITLRGIARTELALGRLAEAAGHAEGSLARFLSLGLDLDTAQALNVLAEIYLESGEADRAETACRRAIEYSRRARSDYEEARALHRLGAAAAQAGRTRVAEQRWTEALAILTRLGSAAAETVRSDLRGLEHP